METINNELITRINDLNADGEIPQHIVSELVDYLENNINSIEIHDDKKLVIDNLKQEMATKTSWRARASLAAKIISLNLE